MPTVPPNPAIPEPHRFSIRLPRPLWFGLGVLFLIATAVGLRVAAPIYREKAAIRELELLGAKVAVAPRGPEWLHERTSLVYAVDQVVLDETKVTDADLMHLRNLGSLRVLSLNATGVTDAGLAHIQGLKGLRTLDIGRTKITDAGLIYLTGLTSLQELDLGGTVVTDDGLKNLKGLTSLQRLVLRSVLADKRVTHAGIADLKLALPGLTIRRF